MNMLTYKHLSTSSAMAKRLAKAHLTSMSINLANHGKMHPVYVVVGSGFDRDLKALQFISFSRQTPLNDWLHENPSGFYQEGDPLHWTVALYKPSFEYRIFEYQQRHYLILKITSGGLVFNLLFHEGGYQIPFIFEPTKLDKKTDRYNWAELLNLGLLGRITGVSYVNPVLSFDQTVTDGLSVAPFMMENDNTRHGVESYMLSLFVGTKEPLYVSNTYSFKHLKVEPNKTTVKQWLNHTAFPKVKYRLLDKDQELEIRVSPLINLDE